MQSDDAIQEMADDIMANGLRQPIVIDDHDEILDGRHRAAACVMAGVQPVYESFVGTDSEKLAFVLSLNLHRRHLDTAQRAMVAERLANLKQGEKKADSGIPLSQPTQAEAASLLNVSVDSVKQARKIRNTTSPETIAAVERGELSLHQAVSTVNQSASSPESSAATVEPKVREKSQSVIQIERTMLKMKVDKKRHPQLERLAQIALDYLGPERRTEVLTRALLNLTPEALSDVFERLEARQNELTKRQTAMS